VRFLDDGRIAMDTNSVDRDVQAVRKSAVPRSADGIPEVVGACCFLKSSFRPRRILMQRVRANVEGSSRCTTKRRVIFLIERTHIVLQYRGK
jgi:hypothetical protein